MPALRTVVPENVAVLRRRRAELHTDVASPSGSEHNGESGAAARRRQRPVGVIVLLHDLGGHAGRLCSLGRVFAAAGWAVHAMDFEAHGESQGMPRGHIR